MPFTSTRTGLRVRLLAGLLLLAAALCAAASPALAIDVPTNAPAGIPGGMRGMWVWSSDTLLSSPGQQEDLAKVAGLVGVTDLFLYVNPRYYASRPAELGAFLKLMGKSHLKVWATDGCRCYFSDDDGPAQYLAGINAMIAFNRQAPPWARFTGFQSDNEPHDIPAHRAAFHNGIASSKLNATGDGVWKASQAADREALLIDWLTIAKDSSELLHAQGLKFGAAMPWWTENYNGEPLTVDIGGGTRAAVSQVMMGLVDDYEVMGYNTDPVTASEHVINQAAFASAIAGAAGGAGHPRVSAAMETHIGFGAQVSYADTPGKQSKAMVMIDMTIIQEALRRYPAFAGVSIEDWTGFHNLPR